MNTTTTTDIITEDLVVIDGINVTDDVELKDGKVVCMWCDCTVEDNNDLGTHFSDKYGQNIVGHYGCLDDQSTNE